jgi:hypothetical protein
VQADQISTLRADQFQESPPVARIVVDLLAPRTFTWAAAGNRLVIHLGKNPAKDENKTPFQAPSVASITSAPTPVAAVAHPNGPLAVASNSLAAGSSITAGADTAVLNLARGGEVHVCPGTTVSVTPSQNGRNVMLGLNTGALEAHYAHLLVHGCLHAQGHDHEVHAEAVRMEARENVVLISNTAYTLSAGTCSPISCGNSGGV